MNAIAMAEDARAYARQLEDNERERHGLTREQARDDVARHTGLPRGTLESLSKRRIKDPNRLFGLTARLHAAVDRMLREEAKRLEHELAFHRAKAPVADADAVREATAALEEARALAGTED